MNIASSLKATLAASVCLLPLQALAQNYGSPVIFDTPAATAPSQAGDNWVTIGGQYNSGRSYYLGRFTGDADPGFYGVGDFHVGGRDAWDSGGTQYWELQGRDLGFDSRSASARFGQQGTWGVSLSYDGIPYDATNSFESVWTKYGTLAPGLNPGGLGVTFRQIAPPVASLGYPYVRGVAGPAIWQPVYTRSPAGLLQNYDISTQRDVFTGVGTYQWQDWTITGSVRHEHKTGFQVNSLNVSGTPSAVSSSATAPTSFTSGMGYFAQPIDYDTDRYDITATYGDPRLQAQVGYSFSNFRDNMAVFDAANPFAFSPTTNFGGAAGVAGMFAPYTAPPSNSAHQINAMVGYNFSPNTRIVANAALGLEMQNQAFQTASGNPAATVVLNGATVSAANLPVPRASLDGLVETFNGNVTFTTRPIRNLDVRLSYTIDDRDNQTPRNLYWEDHNTTATATSVTNIYSNLPYSFDHQTLTAEAGYRILPQTRVTLNDTFETTSRTYANASFVTANTMTAKVRSLMLDSVFGSLSYSHQDRDAHTYNLNSTWMFLGDTARDPVGFMTSFEASRIHDEVKGTLDLSPVHNLTASLMVKFANDRYPDTTYGLRNNHNLSIGPDVNWQVTPALSAHAFYNYQQLFYDQSSIYESSTTAPPTAAQYQVPWTNKTTDSAHTAGVTVDWQAIKDVLKISLDYNFAYGDTAYALGDSVVFFGASVAGSQITQQAITMQPLPDVTSMLNMVSIRGEYTFRPNMTLIVGYAYQRFTYKDFMYSTSPTQYAGLLMPGTVVPNDSVHVVGAGMRIRF